MRHGFDISSNNGRVNWDLVTPGADRPSFVYVKASEGATYTDPRFAENWAGAESAGLSRGAYHFLSTSSSAEQQARHFIELVKDARQLPDDLPPALDIERGLDGTEPDPLAALRWLRFVEAELGVEPLLYLSPDFAARHRSEMPAELAEYPLWIAHWGVTAPTVPWPWSTSEPQRSPLVPRWTMWQRSNTGAVEGVHGDVDLDCLVE